MKLIMTSGGLIVSIMLIIFIHLTVVSDNIIEHETAREKVKTVWIEQRELFLRVIG